MSDFFARDYFVSFSVVVGDSTQFNQIALFYIDVFRKL